MGTHNPQTMAEQQLLESDKALCMYAVKDCKRLNKSVFLLINDTLYEGTVVKAPDIMQYLGLLITLSGYFIKYLCIYDFTI